MTEPIYTFGDMLKAQNRRIAGLEAERDALRARVVDLEGHIERKNLRIESLEVARREAYARCANEAWLRAHFRGCGCNTGRCQGAQEIARAIEAEGEKE